MAKYYKLLILVLLLGGFFINSQPLFASKFQEGLTNTAAKVEELGQPQDPALWAAQVIKTLLTFLGVIFVGLFLYGGFRWMTSFGAPDKVSASKKIMVSAIIGLIIILSAYTIALFVASVLEPSAGTGATPL